MTKDTLYLTQQHQEFKPVLKDRLFHNTWQYSVSFELKEAHCLRSANHQRIDVVLDWIAGNISTWRQSRANTITDELRRNLHATKDFFTDLAEPHKLTVTVHSGTLFVNDTAVIARLAALPGVRITECRQAQINRPTGTILLTNPEHTHRSYFKSIKLTQEKKHQLEQFFLNQVTVRRSPGFVEWFKTPYVRLQDYYFIDHLGESDLIMLALMAPGLVRKTLQIQAR
jgi:hypothetical protein